MALSMLGRSPMNGIMDTQKRSMEEVGSKMSRPHSKSFDASQKPHPLFPPPKTDKPRPHVCTTCTRCFARLEHLKRHERSHTKEKPFSCGDCTRAFARRDLLLRHQQKLHMIAPPSSRGKGARRESTNSTAAGARIRKNSIASSNPGLSGHASMRPRANTISHVDNTTCGLIAVTKSGSSLGHDAMDIGYAGPPALPGVGGYNFRGMSTAAGHHGNPQALPRLETRNRDISVTAGLQTAPPYGGFGGDVSLENMLFSPGSTINPAQLHFPDPMQEFDFESPPTFYHQGYSGFALDQNTLNGDSNLGWLSGFDQQMSFSNMNENAIDDSSPSAISVGSPEALSDSMLDGSHMSSSDTNLWQNSMMSPIAPENPAPTYPESYTQFPISPKSLNHPMGSHDPYFSTLPLPDASTPHALFPGADIQFFQSPTAAHADTPSNSGASISSSNRQSSVTSVSTDSITDATRQALLTTLSQGSVYGLGLKTSQPQASSPLSPAFSARLQSVGNVSLPSTYDLQRYIAAYIQYFHPHLPFLHPPSLSFDSPAFTSCLRATGGQHHPNQPGVTGGGGALILAMAAIGALYEYDFSTSKDLFEMAKNMIQLYLQERRKTDTTTTFHSGQNPSEASAQTTPLWLVQAMLLNVIYGHNCGDKMAANSASTHCAALVSLARSADLLRPTLHCSHGQSGHIARDDLASGSLNGSSFQSSGDVEGEWHAWRSGEERKRTLYAVFILSSLLVSSYNHAPALMNSEIRLDLPCDESLWAAESATRWRSLGECASIDQNAMTFPTALSALLTASQRQNQRQQVMPGLGFEIIPENSFRPSTFGCLVLINALHNYIWETRQQHMGWHWTTQETEAMHAHIEPALRAWQAAWSANPDHSLERPNPLGASSLSADCIPLLDLAHVRLFVNLGKSKEAFFDRNYHAMANELAQGSDIVQHAEHSSRTPHARQRVPFAITRGDANDENMFQIQQEQEKHTACGENGPALPNQCSDHCPKRERHLRKSAFCAANALGMSNKLNVTFADFNSRELPLQSALCSFDCTQVLAEWLSTVQQRVGRYLGILGRDYTDFSQASRCIFLEDEDCSLLERIRGILNVLETKMTGHASTDATGAMNDVAVDRNGCYASRILLVHALMYERQSVWPVTREMALALRTQAAHIKALAEASLAAPPNSIEQPFDQ